MSYDDANEEDVQVKAGADFGALLLNGLVDGIVLDAPNLPNNADAVAYSFGILQAARRRTTKQNTSHVRAAAAPSTTCNTP